MPYSKIKAKSYRWPVKVKTPGDGGVQLEETFDAEFRRVTRPELQKLSEDDDVMVRSILVGWSGILGDDGEELPFSEAARDELMLHQSWIRAVLEAFYMGVNGSRAGN
jgi:hypothetical protein